MYLSPNNLDDVKKMHAERRRADRVSKISSAIFYVLLTAALSLGLGIVGGLAVTVVEIQTQGGNK